MEQHVFSQLKKYRFDKIFAIPYFQLEDGSKVTFKLIKLKSDEASKVKYDAVCKLKAKFPELKEDSDSYKDELINQKSCYLIFNSAREEDDLNKRFFLNADQVNELLDVDQKTELVLYYNKLAYDSLGVGSMTQEQIITKINAIMNAVYEDQEDFFFSMSFLDMKHLVVSLVDQVKILTQNNPSSGN